MLTLYVYKKQKPDGKISYYSAITSEFNNRKSTYYLLINFKKGMELEKNSVIELKKFFFGSYFTGNVVRLKLIVTEYNIIDKDNNVFNDYNEEKKEYGDIGY